MGGGFMADNKDKTMQEQTTTFNNNNNSKHRKRPLQQDLLLRHSHHALSATSPKPKLSPLFPSPLKVILKVPHSSPSPSPTPSSPLSRPSPRSSDPPHRHHRHHHLHHHLSPSPPSPSPSSSPSPSPSSSPTAAPLPSLPSDHPLQRQKLTAELQQYHHSQQQPRPSRPPLQPPLQQIKHPPLDLKQPPQKKLRELSSQLQSRGLHASPNPRLERAKPNGQQAPPDLKDQKEKFNRLGHTQRLAKPNDYKCAEQVDLAISRRYRRPEQEEEERLRHARRGDSASIEWTGEHGQVEQVELVNPRWPRQIEEQADITNLSSLRRSEQGQEFNHSRFRRGESTDQPIGDQAQLTEELERTHEQAAEEVDRHHSRSKRLEVQQLDEGAIHKRPQRRQQQHQEEEHHNHTAPIPKRLRSAHHQGQQEQGRSQLGSPRVTPHNKPTQISSQQHPLKKLTQSSVQGPHGLHQSSKLSSQTTSSPHPVPPSTPASMQSSAPSLSTSGVSDEAHKPSKKRKLQSLLELESTDGQSVAADGAEGQPQVLPAMPAATSAASLPVVPPSMEIDVSKECTTANSSPKRIVQDPQLIPARRLLNNILDRLQKKDKFGVFAEPVDPKEVPNYYDIIKDPMDFGTMRNRVSAGYYTSIELFQKDVFLICDNAMQYNGKGTVYYRHARSIKDVAERILEDLRVSGLSVEMDEPVTKLRSGGVGRSSEKHESCMNTGSPSDARLDNLDEFSGYFLRTSGSIDWKRSQTVDENRRSTYLSTSTSYPGNDSLLTTIIGDSSHLVPTGYQMDFPYSKSLARFAVDLGPLVWKIAAEKIRKALPPGCPFGPGWVGERENGSVMLSPSTKQQMVMPCSTHQTAKLPSEIGAVATSDTGLSSATPSKFGSQVHPHGGYLQDNHEVAMKAESSKSGVQALAKLPNEIRSPVVFGNSLVQNERLERVDQRVLGQPAAQPMTRLQNSEGSRPLGQAYVPADKERPVEFDRTSGMLGNKSGIPGNKSKFAGQVNLNHPVSLQPDEAGIVDDGLSNEGGIPIGRDFPEGRTLPGPGPSSDVIPVSNVGALPFNLGSAFNSTPPQTDRGNSAKSVPAELEMNPAARNQLDGKGTVQFSRLNPLNESPGTEAGSVATRNGKNNVMYQPSNFQMSRGSFMPQNLNMPVHQPCGISNMEARDGNVFEPVRPTSTLSHPVQGFTLQRNSNTPLVQQTAGSSQHSNSSNNVGSRDVSAVDQGLSRQPAPLYQDRAIGERFKETGDLAREKEMLSLAGRMTTGASSTTPRKGLTSERGFTIEQLEPKNGQVSSHDLASVTIQNLDQLSMKQHAFPVANFSPGLPMSNGASSMVREVPGWKPAQQPESILATGKGCMNVENQVLKSTVEQPEVNPGGVPFMRLQTSGVQDPQIYGYGNKKHVSSMPHFLQQQLGGGNIHCLPSQHQQVQLHVQNNSLLPGAQNPISSDSREANFVRQFQLPSHRGFAQAGGPTWQYISQPMVAQGSHHSFAVAPDLNVSLPLTKSPFEQPNGNETQQPDLALQL